ncbi:MAG: aminotransferase class I/II-fold pyridoxal phosphate-dependent enzyme [Acidobacteria bacterium]|nr:aminotransferase class I/II-fold pyridoxal phosphate-dependent enzyme [Acidobacteriota bacterium]NIM61970.1 aminotransferase class I/II-fold pyridoxal phosphate-dependent enzyme [Acidobacteriota bacterium]NIO59692.1 aminotransferase class I/II-fold pyridoxal phosphate-dependent enzyme [Acidobacteriota bacterium]NIQ30787.1 aminotransferase class I/II-fold pyridoxal phosphate-dependent enzyme [Acidobacteriota bacterium]NIQ85820.1 aminotransferase class I/II-fold pyridoxal phosphate-dependent e
MRFATKQIHAGIEHDPLTGSVVPPIYQTTTYVQPSVDEYLSKGYSYSRTGNPTVRTLERKIALLEEGHDATCYSTGMAAIQATMLALLNAGDHAIVSDVAYGGTYRLCTQVLNRFGVEVTFADTSDATHVREALRDNTRLILTETPANPTLKLTDIAAISEIAQERGIPHAVDNTFLTPYYQRPLELGADLSIHSTTKYFDGHNATVGGAVVAKTAELDEKLRFILGSNGTIMSPQVAWLTLQGLKTLTVRLDKQCENAMKVAQFLEAHPKAETVCYPGLESFAQHELAKRQATGFGAMLWFEVVGGASAGKKLMDTVKTPWTLAENLGALESLVTHPATMTHAAVDPAERERVGITDGLVRLSVGLEDAEDLIGALDRALAEI